MEIYSAPKPRSSWGMGTRKRLRRLRTSDTCVMMRCNWTTSRQCWKNIESRVSFALRRDVVCYETELHAISALLCQCNMLKNRRKRFMCSIRTTSAYQMGIFVFSYTVSPHFYFLLVSFWKWFYLPPPAPGPCAIWPNMYALRSPFVRVNVIPSKCVRAYADRTSSEHGPLSNRACVSMSMRSVHFHRQAAGSGGCGRERDGEGFARRTCHLQRLN